MFSKDVSLVVKRVVESGLMERMSRFAPRKEWWISDCLRAEKRRKLIATIY